MKRTATNPISSLPSELHVKVFESLHTPTDALALRSVCRHYQGLWVAYRTSIIHEILARKIECYQYARQLLSYIPGGPEQNADLSDREFVRMERHAALVEEYIHKIEQRVLPRVRTNGSPVNQGTILCGGNFVRSSKLSAYERSRVIRSFYQVWSAAQSGYSNTGICSMPIREQFYLNAFSRWLRSIGFPRVGHRQLYWITQEATRAIERFFEKQYGENAPELVYSTRGDWPDVLVVFWDHRQSYLRQLICQQESTASSGDEGRPQAMAKLWTFEPGDEVLMGG